MDNEKIQQGINNAQAKVLEIQKGMNVSGVASPTTLVDANSLKTTSGNLNLQPNTPASIPDITTLSVATPQPLASAQIAPTTPKPSQSYLDKLSGFLGQKAGQEADTASQVGQATEPFAQQLNELNTQIKTHQANAILRQEKAMQSGETLGFATREAQSIARTDAIQALTLSALAEGMRGNIALAEQHTTNAIKAKYAEIDKQIEDARTNLIDNYDSLSPAEKKKADATLLRLDKDDAFVAEKKRDQESVFAIAMNASQTGLDTKTLQKIQSADTPEEALLIAAEAGVYLPDSPQNTFETRMDANGNLVQFEKAPDGRVVGQKTLSTKTIEATEGAAGATTPENALAQLNFLQDTSKSALKLAHAAGRSPLKEITARALFGATDKTRLEALTNTLRTNVLTLMTDPSIKKFFGPQMSEADVRLMTSAGTTLNPDLQNPSDLRLEIGRLDLLLNKMKTAVSAGVGGGIPQQGNVITAPDGTQVIITD